MFLRNQTGAAMLVFDALLLLALPLLLTLAFQSTGPLRDPTGQIYKLTVAATGESFQQKITNNVLVIKQFCTAFPTCQKSLFPVEKFTYDGQMIFKMLSVEGRFAGFGICCM